MTTVAWDGDTLAADTLCTTDEGSPMYGTKIWRTRAGLFGGCGDDSIIESVRIWLCRGAKPRHRPELHKDAEFTGLLIEPDRTVVVLTYQLTPVRYHRGPTAIGTGGPAARAFMAAGLGARDAVQKVIEHGLDINTGGTVETLRLTPRKRAKPSRP